MFLDEIDIQNAKPTVYADIVVDFNHRLANPDDGTDIAATCPAYLLGAWVS